MHLLRKQAILMTAFLAVMLAQAFGLERGYASHHGISVIEREFGESTGTVPFHTVLKTQSGRDGGPENHAPITVDMEPRRSGLAAGAALEFTPVQISEISVRDWIFSQQAVESMMLSKASADIPVDISPAAAVQVARCMVMLI